MIDNIKDLGYKFSTLIANTINAFDGTEPSHKKEYLAEAEAKVLENEKLFKRGLITNDEKIDNNIEVGLPFKRNLKARLWTNLKTATHLKPSLFQVPVVLHNS